MSPADRAAHIDGIVATAPPLSPGQASTIRSAMGTRSPERRNAPGSNRERSAPRGEWSPPPITIAATTDTPSASRRAR